LLIGPVLSREMVTAARRVRLYFSRAGYVLALTMLMATAWLILSGSQNVRSLSDLARFGSILFQILATLQLALAVFFSALFAASAVSQEKDRRTFVLLLLTDLSNSQLVLGKLLASLLIALVMLAAALPFFVLAVLLGGISFGQVGRVFAVTLISSLVAGSLGSTIALWRDKTFQALATTSMVLVFWLAFWELVRSEMLGSAWLGVSVQSWAIRSSPWQAILVASQPIIDAQDRSGWFDQDVNLFLLMSALGAVALNLLAILKVRVWNPSRQIRPLQKETARQDSAQRESNWHEHDRPARKGESDGPAGAAAEVATEEPSRRGLPPVTSRRVWNNPILWREVCTWAYGRKVVVIRLAYVMFFLATALVVQDMIARGDPLGDSRSLLPVMAMPLAPLFLLSLVLINALAVTSLTTERDGQAMDLILASDVTPKEFVFGKLGGVLYNSKEMIVLPMVLSAYGWQQGTMSGENLLYVLIGLAVMNVFVAVLGIHVGMTYVNSRHATGVSIGTILFLFVGVATCMRMMVAFSDSFEMQLAPFVAVMLGGGVGLYVALGYRNPSAAIGLASFAAPPLTFYALTSFLIGNPLAVILTMGFTYGFATAAMLVPAIAEFDVATGRTTAGED